MPHVAKATAKPTTTCPATTHQGETDGFCSRNWRACSAVSGLNDSGSSASVSGYGAIVFILNDAPVDSPEIQQSH
jgi:hypothetical protein